MTPTQLNIWKSPTIASQLPYRFENGYSFDLYQCHCARCKQILPNDETHGTIKPFNSSMVTIEAMAYCSSCHLFTPSSYRVYNNLDFMGLDQSGTWQRWQSTYSPYAKVQKMLRQVFRLLGFS